MVLLVALSAVAFISLQSSPALASAQASPQFRLGFKALADQVPQVVGSPQEEEHWGEGGDSLQQTSTGLMVWRKADNWTAFTNGSRTWVNGPYGVMERGNEERFEWEAPNQLAVRVESLPTATPQSSADASAEMAALGMINRSRQENGAGPVAMDPAVQQVARSHARDMATRGFFGHSNPEGAQPWDRLSAAGIGYSVMAENIGWSQNYGSAADGVRTNHQSMMAERPPNDGHRVNILNPRITRIGIGVFTAPDGKVYYVTDFVG
jgi:uncharacterized protein YkwD